MPPQYPPTPQQWAQAPAWDPHGGTNPVAAEPIARGRGRVDWRTQGLKRARTVHRVPYIGADPPPSRGVGRWLQVAAAMFIAARVVEFGAYVREALRDRDLAAGAATAAQLRKLDPVVTVAGVLGTIALVAFLFARVRWTKARHRVLDRCRIAREAARAAPDHRRPDIVKAQAEGYIEAPLRAVWPEWVWHLRMGLALLGVAIGAFGRVDVLTPAGHIAVHRLATALDILLLAGVFGSTILMVRVANAHHDERVAHPPTATLPGYRVSADPVYLTGVAGIACFAVSPGFVLADRAEGWVFTLNGIGLFLWIAGLVFCLSAGVNLIRRRFVDVPDVPLPVEVPSGPFY